MVLAADYPFLDVLWTMILFFCWVAWIWLLIMIFSDLFRRDLSGWAKAAWIFFLIVLPFLGALIYVIADGKGMTDRRVRDVAASQAQFDDREQLPELMREVTARLSAIEARLDELGPRADG